jgi:hypothetical protein
MSNPANKTGLPGLPEMDFCPGNIAKINFFFGHFPYFATAYRTNVFFY